MLAKNEINLSFANYFKFTSQLNYKPFEKNELNIKQNVMVVTLYVSKNIQIKNQFENWNIATSVFVVRLTHSSTVMIEIEINSNANVLTNQAVQ